MIDRICISINKRCNLTCAYCHFREKNEVLAKKALSSGEIVAETASDSRALMDVYEILDQVKGYLKENPSISVFKIGFVGDGEPFLDFDLLKSYILYVQDSPQVQCYTISNGTIPVGREGYAFLKEHSVTVGISLDGPGFLHDSVRCPSFQRIMTELETYVSVFGEYPSFNATVGRDTLEHASEVIEFFKGFGSRVTFSRMIGANGISLSAYEGFLQQAEERLHIRRGGRDCSMYGGTCSAGDNNFYFAEGKVFLCGNCVDLPPLGRSGLPFSQIQALSKPLGHNFCYKESLG